MPTVYRCKSCGLSFQPRWYHCHREIERAMSATLLACTSCGAAYMLDHKCDDSRDELYAWSGQVTAEPSEESGVFRNISATQPMEKIPTSHDFRPTRESEAYARLEAIQDKLRLSDFRCAFCGKIGTLTSRWPESVNRCPRCSGATLEVVSNSIT